MARTPTARRQTITVTIATPVTEHPHAVLSDLLTDEDRVLGHRVEHIGRRVDVLGPDRDRLVKLLAWAAGEDAKRRLGLSSEWDQTFWITRDNEAGNACGTACCIAGKVALDDGARPVARQFDEAADRYVTVDWTSVEPGGDGSKASQVTFPDKPDETVDVRVYAKDTLGLTNYQAEALFAASNDLDALVEAVQEILDDDGTALDADVATTDPGPVVAVRRLREGRVRDCGDGDTCDICYETVTVAPGTEDTPS